MKTLRQSCKSITYFINLVFTRSLHKSKKHLQDAYTVSDGKTYTVFRETISDKEYNEREVTLIIGFRLALIGKNRVFHWLFQRLCMLDTPIWVGFMGFKQKFWMVEPKSKYYLGLYRYQGIKNAKTYAKYIAAVLRPVSTYNSVWYQIENKSFDSYINTHQVRSNSN